MQLLHLAKEHLRRIYGQPRADGAKAAAAAMAARGAMAESRRQSAAGPAASGRIALERTDAATLVHVIEDLETTMFVGWKPVQPRSQDMLKNFASPEEARRTRHLMLRMTKAFGLSYEQSVRAFREPPQDTALVVQATLLKTLARIEHSEIARVGRSRRGYQDFRLPAEVV